MSQQTAWQECNSAYLSASLSWLQLLLQLRIQSTAKVSSNDSQPDDSHALTQKKDEYVQDISEIMLEEQIASKAEEIAELERSMQEAPPALIQLSTRLHLSRFEQNILLLCIAAELDLSMRHLYAQVQDAPGKAYPTFALAMVLFADPFWAALAPDQPLRHLQLIEIDRTI
jgi:molecular chaperone GrpE (heat shock protein)